MKINKEQESALVGMVLGDAYLQKTGTQNARLRLEHRADHREYLIWKTHLLPHLFQGAPTFLDRIHPDTHRTYSYVRQQSNASPYLGKMRASCCTPTTALKLFGSVPSLLQAHPSIDTVL